MISKLDPGSRRGSSSEAVLGPLALIIGAGPRWTALGVVAFTVVTLWMTYRHSGLGALMRPRQNVEFYRTLAIVGGLLFCFGSGPGTWSWKGGAGRSAKARTHQQSSEP